MIIIKKIISFEIELLFKTKVCEITSISLEHHINKIDENLISGKFIINGDYKMTEGSIIKEKFDFDINFDIALDNRYDTKDLVIDIDDFNYHIINDEILKVNIDLFIEGDVLKEDVVVISKPDDILMPVIGDKIDNKESIRKRVDEPKIELAEEQMDIINNPDTTENNTVFNDSIFGNINNSETYATYYVYIVKDDDTIDKIIDKYKVSKDDISMYNTLENIVPGDKIIIPTTNGE